MKQKHLLQINTYYRTKDNRWYRAIEENYWLQPAKVVKGDELWGPNPELTEKFDRDTEEKDRKRLTPVMKKRWVGWTVDGFWIPTKAQRNARFEKAKQRRRHEWSWLIDIDSASIMVE